MGILPIQKKHNEDRGTGHYSEESWRQDMSHNPNACKLNTNIVNIAQQRSPRLMLISYDRQLLFS